ncbi:MAG: CYTH domain-containing protein [Succinivibrio sp.]|nr:CYTH domain-containing protein [Succinivibrio sp.]
MVTKTQAAAKGAKKSAGKTSRAKVRAPKGAPEVIPQSKGTPADNAPVNREIEIKLGVMGNPGDLPEIFASFGRVSNVKSDVLENTYFDTIDQDLFKKGIGLRIRHGKNVSEQTIKLRGKNLGGVHSRGEFNIPIGRSVNKPQLAKFPAEALAGCDPAKLEKAVAPVCKIRFTRESFDFEIMDSMFEVAYDHGAIALEGGVPYPINELEVELKHTTRSADSVLLIYNALVSTFAEKGLPLVMEPFSKMHRASVLILGERNLVKFSDSAGSADLCSYIENLLSTFENLYGLFLLKHDPLVFSFQNSALRTLVRCLKTLRREAPAAFYKDEREPVNYDQDLKVIIRTIKDYERRCRKYEKKIARRAIDFDEFSLSVLVDRVRRIENECRIYVIPLKLRVLLSMIVRQD